MVVIIDPPPISSNFVGKREASRRQGNPATIPAVEDNITTAIGEIKDETMEKISPAEATKSSSTITTKVPKSVSDKKRFFESAMEDQHKPTQKSDKVFSFLSKDEVEKLKQEEQRKIATLRCDKKKSRLLDDANSKIDNRDDDDDDEDDNQNDDDDDSAEEDDYSDDDDDEQDTDDDIVDVADMHHQQHIQPRNANDNIDVLLGTLSDDDAEDISSKIVNQIKNLKPTATTSSNTKTSKLKAPTLKVKATKESVKQESITNKTTKKVILKPTTTTAKTSAIPTTTTTATIAVARDDKDSKGKVRNKPEVKQVPPSETTAKTSTQAPELTKKPSLLPKPKVKVVIPPVLLHKQQQKQQQPQQQQQHPHQQEQQFVEDEEVAVDEHEYEFNVAEEQEPEVACTASSRIPVRTANAEKRALQAGMSATTSSSEQTSPTSTSDLKKSKALINAEKRASWRAARLRSLEKGAVEAQSVIQNMTKIADDLLTGTLPAEAKKIVFPKIAIKSSDGPVIIREREKILDEKIVRRTEEVACPITGRPQLRTVEYIEKIIETEVETSREKIISLELQDPEKSDTPHASIDIMTQYEHEDVERQKAHEMFEQQEHDVGAPNVQHNQERRMPQQVTPQHLQTQVSDEDKHKKSKELQQQMPKAMSRTLVETVENLHITQKYDNSNDSNKTETEEKELREYLKNLNEDEVEQEREKYDDEEEEEEEEETDSASIVTVQQNIEKLFLRNEDDELPSIELESLSSGGIFGPSSLDSVGSSTKVSIKPSTIAMHQTLAKEVVLPATKKLTTTVAPTFSKSYDGIEDDDDEEYEYKHNVSATSTNTLTPATTTKRTTTRTQNIVEVVNPLIAGEGQVQRIAFSRSHRSGYPSFDDEDIEDEQHFENLPSSLKILRSETFVLPPTKVCEELSLNAKMKNVLEELLENERVKYNLQKSLEEQGNYNDDTAKPAYGDVDDEQDDDDDMDEIDFSVAQTSKDDNGNHHVLNALIRDSNRNTLQKLQSQLKDEGIDGVKDDRDNDDDEDEYEYEVAEEEEEEESEDTEESESSDSDDDEDDDDDETIHITFVDGAKVIENFNTNTPMKLQKSQTYNTMKEAAEALTEEPEDSQVTISEKQIESQSTQDDDTQITLEKLLAEQQKYAEISKQLRKSVENLLVDDENDLPGATTTSTTSTSAETQQKPKTKRVVVMKKSSKPKPVKLGGDTQTGEEIFNRLLQAGGSRKQIFDQETDETLTSSTITCTEDDGTIITTTTTTISNVTTSGIPRITKHVEEVVKTPANKKKSSKNDADHREKDNDGKE